MSDSRRDAVELKVADLLAKAEQQARACANSGPRFGSDVDRGESKRAYLAGQLYLDLARATMELGVPPLDDKPTTKAELDNGSVTVAVEVTVPKAAD
jgi:hypothetical protein